MTDLSRRFVISDHHLGHENIIKFEHDGKPLRDFASMTDMHQAIIDGHNSVVTAADTVYFIGDVVMNWKRGHEVLYKMNGRKILIHGNHDLEDTAHYLKFFAKVVGVIVLPNIAVLTHVPVHPECLKRPSWPRNIHGHLHRNVIPDQWGKPDPRYINVCVEQLDYVPKRIEELVR